MPADMNRRLNRILVALSQNEALTDNLLTDTACALLDWSSALARDIVSATADIEDKETADAAMYPRLRALRQVMRQVNNLFAPGADPDAAAAALALLLPQAAIVYGELSVQPTPESCTAFLSNPPANTADWINSLRAWLEDPNS